MQKVIKGKQYDTETAIEICRLPCERPRNDFGYHETTLYRSPKGVFFIWVNGPLASLCGKGPMIEVVDRFKAWDIAESANCTSDEMKAAGFEPEEG